jgi:hypothetical protein
MERVPMRYGSKNASKRASTHASRNTVTDKVLRTVKEHPIGTAAVAAGAIAGAALIRKAANTAAKVVTIKAVAGAAKDVAGAVRSRPSGARRKTARRRATSRRGRGR